MFKKSWKTSACGLLAAIGLYLAGIKDAPSWLPQLAEFLQLFGTAGMGYFARDSNVSSEAQGAK